MTSPFIDGILGFFARSNDITVMPFSQLNTAHQYDIIHTQHHNVTSELVKHFQNTPFISTIHSELLELENPVISERIKRYIAIRPEIKAHLINKFNIDSQRIDVIYNPVNEERFNTKNIQSRNSVLFVGTIDYLRKNAIFDMIHHTKANNQEFWLVGRNQSDYLAELIKFPHVKYSWDCHDVEKFTKLCNETAGILLGRTTIEGWLCGKAGWIYDIDSTGNIINKKLYPAPSDVEKFTSYHVAKKIETLYLETINTSTQH